MVDYNQYVTDLYRNELGRDPDPEGFAGWVNALSSGVLTPQQVAEGFNRSSEGINYDINRLYQSELGRAPDEVGVSGWGGALASGSINENDLQQMIRQSPEYGSLAADQYRDLINKAYEQEVGRSADPAGLTSWATQLRSGAIKPEQLPGLVQGSNEGWLYDVYKDVLGRGFDPAAAEWTRALESGQMTRDQVLAAIKGSQEYLARNPQMQPGGVSVPIPGLGGSVSAFQNYAPMKPLADPRSQTFGFLYDTINQRLGRDVTPRGLLDVNSINAAFNNPGTGGMAASAQQQTPASTGATNPNVVGGLLDARNLVSSLYQQELGRAPDYAGLDSWSNAVYNGMTRDQLLANIRGSAEYQSRVSGSQAAADAEAAYQAALANGGGGGYSFAGGGGGN